jgi:hypothetical protein
LKSSEHYPRRGVVATQSVTDTDEPSKDHFLSF